MSTQTAETPAIVTLSGQPYAEPRQNLRIVWCTFAHNPCGVLCAQKLKPQDPWELDHQAWQIERFLCMAFNEEGNPVELQAAGLLNADAEGVVPKGVALKKPPTIFTYNQMIEVMGRYYRVDARDPKGQHPDHLAQEMRDAGYVVQSGHITSEVRAAQNEQVRHHRRREDEHAFRRYRMGQSEGLIARVS